MLSTTASPAAPAASVPPVDASPSVSEVYGVQPASRCGYCRSKKSSVSFGAWMHTLSVDDYEALIFRGWRRSGHYLYRPDLAASCCQAFAIRLRASDYEMSSTQKRVVGRLEKACGKSDGKERKEGEAKKVAAEVPAVCRAVRGLVCEALERAVVGEEGGPGEVGLCFAEAAQSAGVSVFARARRGRKKGGEQAQKRKRRGTTGVEGGGEEPSVAEEGDLCTNAAMVVGGIERKLGKNEGVPKVDKNDVVKRQMEIAEIVAEKLRMLLAAASCEGVVDCSAPGWVNISLVPEARERLSVDLEVPDEAKDEALNFARAEDRDEVGMSACSSSGPSGDTLDTAMSGSDSDSSEDWGNSGDVDDNEPFVEHKKVPLHPLPGGRHFALQFVPSSFRPDEYSLYRSYQRSIHKSKPRECTEKIYRRFLCDSPLRRAVRPNGPAEGYGSFHIRYTLDGKLFAVGVVDILPQCLSSVYLFFDPGYAALSPGVLSAVKEIEWVRQTCLATPRLQYYFMGYYIHTCEKMAYKALYRPSELLCDETRHWMPTTNALAVLDAAVESKLPVNRLAPPGVPPALSAGRVSAAEMHRLVGEMQMKVDGRLVPFSEIERMFGQRLGKMCVELRNNLTQFALLIGVEFISHFINRLQ